MLFMTEPPPPPPSTQMFQVFLPIAHKAPDYICIAIEGQYESLCDYIHQDGQYRWFLTDEGLFDQFTSKPYLTIKGHPYSVLEHDNGESLPSYNNIIYIFMDGWYYWVRIGTIDGGE